MASLKQRLSVTLSGIPIYGVPTEAVATLSAESNRLQIYLLENDLRSAHYHFQFDLATQLDEYCHVEDRLRGLMYLVISERNLRVVNQQFSRQGVRNLSEEEEVEQSTFFQNSASAPDEGAGSTISRVKQLAEGFDTRRKVRIYPNKGRKKVWSENGTSTPSTNRFSILSDMLDDDSDSGTLEFYLNSSEDDSTDTDSDDNEKNEGNPEQGRLFLITKGYKKLRRRKRKNREHLEIDEDVAAAGELFVCASSLRIISRTIVLCEALTER